MILINWSTLFTPGGSLASCPGLAPESSSSLMLHLPYRISFCKFTRLLIRLGRGETDSCTEYIAESMSIVYWRGGGEDLSWAGGQEIAVCTPSSVRNPAWLTWLCTPPLAGLLASRLTSWQAVCLCELVCVSLWLSVCWEASVWNLNLLLTFP